MKLADFYYLGLSEHGITVQLQNGYFDGDDFDSHGIGGNLFSVKMIWFHVHPDVVETTNHKMTGI